MSENSERQPNRYAYTQNRELSWLSFNHRVLEEANDKGNPLLERLKFVAIFSSNLDEFFMARVGSLFDVMEVSPKDLDNKSGMTSEEQLNRIYATVPGLVEQKITLYRTVMNALAQEGIEDVLYSSLDVAELAYINQYYKSSIQPIISPIIVGSHHPAPHLKNKQLYLATALTDKKGKFSLGFVKLPEALPLCIPLPGRNLRFIRLDNLLLHWAPTLFGNCHVEETCILSVTRNADLRFDHEKFEDSDEDFRSRILALLKRRDKQSVVRLALSRHLPASFLQHLRDLIQVDSRQIFYDACPLNMGYVFQLGDGLDPEMASRLLYLPYHPRWPEDIFQETSILEQIRQRDHLLFFPFDSVDPFLRLLSEAAERPDVVSIKITIYRLASSSKIAHTLCRAAENGKEVIVLMELRARFDEANNITWSKLLEDAGCQVIYGAEDFKCHSKLCLITLRSKGKAHYITQVGTGNYNEKTNVMYTDLTMMTASQSIGEDGTAFFQKMLVNNLDGSYQQLLVAPTGIKPTLIHLIDQEIAKRGQGYLCMKVNSITERDLIDKLREASQAGVEIQLIVRGICCLLPGVPGETEHISVTRIVGRYLEHARIYCFGRGGDAKIFLSSADLMTRNLNRRVEIACPVSDPGIRSQLQWILSTQLQDTGKARVMLPDGTYQRKKENPAIPFCSQVQFMEKPAILPLQHLHNPTNLSAFSAGSAAPWSGRNPTIPMIRKRGIDLGTAAR